MSNSTQISNNLLVSDLSLCYKSFYMMYVNSFKHLKMNKILLNFRIFTFAFLLICYFVLITNPSENTWQKECKGKHQTSHGYEIIQILIQLEIPFARIGPLSKTCSGLLSKSCSWPWPSMEIKERNFITGMLKRHAKFSNMQNRLPNMSFVFFEKENGWKYRMNDFNVTKSNGLIPNCYKFKVRRILNSLGPTNNPFQSPCQTQWT